MLDLQIEVEQGDRWRRAKLAGSGPLVDAALRGGSGLLITGPPLWLMWKAPGNDGQQRRLLGREPLGHEYGELLAQLADGPTATLRGDRLGSCYRPGTNAAAA